MRHAPPAAFSRVIVAALAALALIQPSLRGESPTPGARPLVGSKDESFPDGSVGRISESPLTEVAKVRYPILINNGRNDHASPIVCRTCWCCVHQRKIRSA